MRIQRLVVVAVLACGGAVSCSGSKAPASCTPGPPVQVIQLQDFAFAPSCIAAPSGSHLTLQNTGSVPHTFTVHDTSIDQSVDVGAGAEVSFSGVAPGTYSVVCTIHPQMTATLVVS